MSRGADTNGTLLSVRNLKTYFDEDGRVVRRRVPVGMLRSGVIQKPIVRAPFTIDEETT